MKYALLITLFLAGCSTKYVPVELSEAPVPPECKRQHYRDLAPVPPMEGPQVSPDEINKHWAKHYRLKARVRYRNLRRDYQICSKYARR